MSAWSVLQHQIEAVSLQKSSCGHRGAGQWLHAGLGGPGAREEDPELPRSSVQRAPATAPGAALACPCRPQTLVACHGLTSCFGPLFTRSVSRFLRTSPLDHVDRGCSGNTYQGFTLKILTCELTWETSKTPTFSSG